MYEASTWEPIILLERSWSVSQANNLILEVGERSSESCEFLRWPSGKDHMLQIALLREISPDYAAKCLGSILANLTYKITRKYKGPKLSHTRQKLVPKPFCLSGTSCSKMFFLMHQIKLSCQTWAWLSSENTQEEFTSGTLRWHWVVVPPHPQVLTWLGC